MKKEKSEYFWKKMKINKIHIFYAYVSIPLRNQLPYVSKSKHFADQLSTPMCLRNSWTAPK